MPQAATAGEGYRVVDVGIRHGTVGILAPCQTRMVEVTTFRVEGPYSDSRRPDYVRFVDHLEEDLCRRDFTVNAMALDPFSGSLYDPCGGREDIEKGIVRAVGDPGHRFEEDALRLVRAVRLVSQYGWCLDADTAAAAATRSHLIAKVAPERIRTELEGILLGSHASRALALMSDLGLARHVLPDLPEASYVPELSYLPARLPLRLAALLLADEDPEAALRRLRFPTQVVKQVGHLIQHARACLPPIEPDRPASRTAAKSGSSDAWWAAATEADSRRWLAAVGRENAAEVLHLVRAHLRAAGRDLTAWDGWAHLVARQLAARVPTRLEELAVTGTDVLEITGGQPGPQVREILMRLLDAVLEDPGLNERTILRQLIHRFLDPGGGSVGST